MAKFPLVEDNVVSNLVPDRVAWTLNAPPYFPTMRAIERFTEWAEANGLDIRTIPAESEALVIRAETPDGGLLADVTEFEMDADRHVIRDPNTPHARRLPRRTVPVDSIPPVLGIIPTWAAAMTNTTREETRA